MRAHSTKLVIFGTGDVGSVAWATFVEGPFEIVAFTVDDDHMKGATHLGLPVVPFSAVAQRYPPSEHALFVAIGYREMNRIRQRKVGEAKGLGYQLASYVAPLAYVSKQARIGANCLVMEASVVQPFAEVGENCIVGPAAHVGHHSRIGSHCWLSPHASVAGHVSVGDNCFIGLNASIRDHINVANSTLVGAGAVILHDTIATGVYPGEESTARAVNGFRAVAHAGSPGGASNGAEPPH